MRYKVREVYTPDDAECDRARREGSFESDSTDLFELALLARKSCYTGDIVPKDEALRKRLEFDDVSEQLADGEYEPSYFEFKLWENSGEWDITVEAQTPLEGCVDALKRIGM
jgi:hypothetical protein